jgi:hypothetical protein
MALYEDTEPCLYVQKFSERMQTRIDFAKALKRCVDSRTCDGIYLCDSGREARGFEFKHAGGKEENPVRPSEGNAVILKGCPGDCGSKGRSAILGDCKPMESLTGYISEKKGLNVVKDHRVCNHTPLRFTGTGLVSDVNFPSGTGSMVIRESSMDAKMCSSICKDDVRCDGVVYDGDTCELFAMERGRAPTLRPAEGSKTVFIGGALLHAVTRGDVLKAAGDPADMVKLPSKGVQTLQDVWVRVWCRHDNEARVEAMLKDGLKENETYYLTLEGPAANGDTLLTANWTDGMAERIDIKRSGNTEQGYLKAKFFLKVSFVARRTAHLEEMLWLEDPVGRRTRPHDMEKLGVRGTHASFENNKLRVSAADRGPAANWSHGQLAMRGEVLSQNNYADAPTKESVLSALCLTGVKVTKKGSTFEWEPISPGTIPVNWISANGTDGIIHNLGLPSLGGDSVVVIYTGAHLGDLVPACKVCSRGMEYATIPPVLPRGYQTWVNAPSREILRLSTNRADGSGGYGCAVACNNMEKSVDGVSCNAFSFDGENCYLYDWQPNVREDHLWGGEGSTLVYHRGSKPSIAPPVIDGGDLGGGDDSEGTELDDSPLIGDDDDVGFSVAECLSKFSELDPPRVVVKGWPTGAMKQGSEITLEVQIAGSEELLEVYLPLYYLPDVIEFLPLQFTHSNLTSKLMTLDLLDKGVAGIMLRGRIPVGTTFCVLVFRIANNAPPSSRPLTVGRHKGIRKAWVTMAKQGGGAVATQSCSSMAGFEGGDTTPPTTHPELAVG